MELTVSTTNEHRLIDGFFINFANPRDFLLNNGSPTNKREDRKNYSFPLDGLSMKDYLLEWSDTFFNHS